MALEGTWNGMALRLRRIQAGLRIDDLCALMREDGFLVDGSTVCRWEAANGTHVSRRPGDDEAVECMARIFGCSTMAFYRTTILTYDAAESD